jgi:hypothetical protein
MPQSQAFPAVLTVLVGRGIMWLYPNALEQANPRQRDEPVLKADYG